MNSQVIFRLNTTANNRMAVLLHPKHNIVIPNRKSAYGSNFEIVWLPTERPTPHNLFLTLSLAKNRWRTIDTPEDRCTEDPNANVARCIAQFVEGKIGCG